MNNYEQNQERNRECTDNVANTDLAHTGTRTSNSNTYHYKELRPPSARHQPTTLALPEAAIAAYSKNKHQQIEFRKQLT